MDGITIRLSQDYYPTNINQMTLVLENRSDSVMMYGNGWSFEKYENGKWWNLALEEGFAYTLEGILLFDHDKNIFRIPDYFFREPFSEGLYRVTGCSLWVTPESGNSGGENNDVEFPPYQCEFVVSETAVQESEATPVTALLPWQLPEKEDWEWYPPGTGFSLYASAGMQVWQCVQGDYELVAILYRNSTENEYYNAGDLLLMDIFDRSTGKRYEVFTEPTVAIEKVEPYQDGFKIDSGDFYYCCIDDSDCVVLLPLAS